MLERETSAQSPDEEIESYDGEDKEEVVNESEGEVDRSESTRLNSSHLRRSRMPSSA